MDGYISVSSGWTMKLLLYILIVIRMCDTVSAAPYRLERRRSVIVAPPIACALWGNHSQTSDDFAYQSFTEGDLAQGIKNTNGLSSVCSVEMKLGYLGVDCDVHAELWTTQNESGSQIGLDSDSYSVSTGETTPQFIVFNFPSSPLPTTNFYVHLTREDSNDCEWRAAHAVPLGAAYEDQDFCAGVSDTVAAVQDDFCFKINTNTPDGTILLREGFEGFQSVGFDNSSWTISGTPTNNATSPTPVQGAFCFSWVGVADNSIVRTIPSTDEVWVRFLWQKSADPTFTGDIFKLSNGGSFVKVQSASGVLGVTGDQGLLAVCGTFPNNAQWYYVWLHYRKSDHFVSVSFNTTLSEPSSGGLFASTTSFVTAFSTVTATTAGTTEASKIFSIDEIIIKSSAIGNDPY